MAFVHQLSPAASGWVLGHEQGKEYLVEKLGNKLTVRSYFNADTPEEATRLLEEAVKEYPGRLYFRHNRRFEPAFAHIREIIATGKLGPADGSPYDDGTAPAPSAPSAQASNAADELKKFKELLDQGVITEEEFQVKKAQLLKTL